MELSAMWAIVLAVCGGVLTIINTIDKIVGAGKAINAPNVEQDRRIAALEVRCDKYDRYFDSDKQRISDLEQMLSVLMQAQFALLSHAINGNDTEKLKEVQSHMMDYLTNRGIKV
jgi:hypothetical protein